MTTTRSKQTPGRFALVCLAASALLVAGASAHHASAQSQPYPQTQAQPAPIERRAPSTQPVPSPGAPARQGSYSLNPQNAQHPQPHLSQWMESHRSLPLAQQQRALAAEPGFRQLQPAEQTRMQERLEQLNSMSPERRQRVLARTEAMERLSPPQRQQVRGALKDLGALPEDRRRAVARTFHGLRELPPGQQRAYLDGSQIHSQFSPQERYTLTNLLNAAPYLPVSDPARDQPHYGTSPMQSPVEPH